MERAALALRQRVPLGGLGAGPVGEHHREGVEPRVQPGDPAERLLDHLTAVTRPALVASTVSCTVATRAVFSSMGAP